MSGERRNALSGRNRACMQGQNPALMTQSCPRLSQQKDLNILPLRSCCRPDANLPTTPNLEVRNVFYPNKRMFGRVLKHESVVSFRKGGMARSNLNSDIEAS